MKFIDIIHGQINFSESPYRELVHDLSTCPEVQRLRHMRLMNFDVPFIQDLASAKRFPHSIGVCYLAYKHRNCLKSNKIDRLTLVSAALLHDIGILPQGHLVETLIKKEQHNFSHEKIVKSILYGNYHPTNKYHQIIGGKSLQIYRILRKYKIDIERVIELICPHSGSKNAISADIDFDNIDSIFRMAAFLNYPDVKSHLKTISDNCTLDTDMKINFMPKAVPSIKVWQNIRRKIYSMIIAHPECVAYNAFLNELSKSAIENNLIGPENWFISDSDLENALLISPATKDIGNQLVTGCEYSLVDYIWFKSCGEPPIKNWRTIDIELKKLLGPAPSGSMDYFIWVENKLITRKINVKSITQIDNTLGEDSVSLLISLITTSEAARKKFNSHKLKWRRMTIDIVQERLSDWQFEIEFPEDYRGDYYLGKSKGMHFGLFD